MKLITMVARIDEEKCTGCQTCVKVCPTLAIKMNGRKAKVDVEKCRGCGNCNQRCPSYAVTMEKLDKPYKVFVRIDDLPYEKIEGLCKKAKLNPEQIICYCTATRAEEAAAAILKGAVSPEEVSLLTGIRTGCKVECIQPVLRLLEANGVKPKRPEGGFQWYGRTPTAWEIPEEVKEKYNHRGFYFNEDIKLLDAVREAGKEGK
ncbi:MAG: 4Fe-4S binding protein [Peptococcaceae bacterium]|jgi:Fe-S-cluster-containing hydrogenase component 2|nr:4Fe-4S binding protein [Peptococcaceae bacterium]MDH7525066.1 4Fe-4S binding protein [Peptococcaceae bacterium]